MNETEAPLTPELRAILSKTGGADVQTLLSALSTAEERIEEYEAAWKNLERLLPGLPSPETVALMNTDPWTDKEKAALAAYRASEQEEEK